MKILNEAEYLIELYSNNVSDATRQNFASDIDYTDTDWCGLFFGTIIITVIKGMKESNYTFDAAKSAVKNEFDKMGLSAACGDYSNFEDFVIVILEASTKKRNSMQDFIDLCKSIVDSADKMNDEYRANVYYSALRHVVAMNSVLEDIEFTRKLTTYLNDAENVSTELLSQAIAEVIR